MVTTATSQPARDAVLEPRQPAAPFCTPRRRRAGSVAAPHSTATSVVDRARLAPPATGAASPRQVAARSRRSSVHVAQRRLPERRARERLGRRDALARPGARSPRSPCRATAGSSPRPARERPAGHAWSGGRRGRRRQRLAEHVLEALERVAPPREQRGRSSGSAEAVDSSTRTGVARVRRTVGLHGRRARCSSRGPAKPRPATLLRGDPGRANAATPPASGVTNARGAPARIASFVASATSRLSARSTRAASFTPPRSAMFSPSVSLPLSLHAVDRPT